MKMFGKGIKLFSLFGFEVKIDFFGGVAEMGDEQPSPKTELLMAAAGPLASAFSHSG
jgi:hypothetical protein